MSGTTRAVPAKVNDLVHCLRSPDRVNLQYSCLLKWLVLGSSSAAGITFLGLHLSCSRDAYSEPAETCYRIISALLVTKAADYSANTGFILFKQRQPSSFNGWHVLGESIRGS